MQTIVIINLDNDYDFKMEVYAKVTIEKGTYGEDADGNRGVEGYYLENIDLMYLDFLGRTYSKSVLQVNGVNINAIEEEIRSHVQANFERYFSKI